MNTTATLPLRAGGKPRTTKTNPHMQLDQAPDVTVLESVIRRAAALPGVRVAHSLRAPAGTAGLFLSRDDAQGPDDAFLLGTEFAHFHPLPDGSMHMTLPAALRQEVIENGWGESHPLAGFPTVSSNTLMVFAPRDASEGEILFELIQQSWAYARGELTN
ncbi:luciferase family protein [Noviherbaspirillum denitrificans]|uniref:Luciferase domain-containing protein n=1 Tax=Noviherbaspirillum denitrificans TaxID=1968433 RepID=A0A254TM76_9BURK|nr:luciferase family protein [Noviherbaspirillum denitrificans]OWW20808.1 hypothetical protein AYR66_16365 [Noviherbaspirillum denitrificans]